MSDAARAWRIALVDSCGLRADADAAASFADVDGRIERGEPLPDPSGHGSRIAEILADRAADLLLAQVHTERAPATAAAVASALDWCLASGADLVHMSLGLGADRAVLAAAVSRALAAGCVLVVSSPARGAATYPAAYDGVIAATGDARCAPGEISALGPARFGGCPRAVAAARAGGGSGGGAGASFGAAWVTRRILDAPRTDREALLAWLHGSASYRGAERRG